MLFLDLRPGGVVHIGGTELVLESVTPKVGVTVSVGADPSTFFCIGTAERILPEVSMVCEYANSRRARLGFSAPRHITIDRAGVHRARKQRIAECLNTTPPER